MKMLHHRKILLIVVLGYILIYLASLGIRPLLMPDETRYAEIPREMLSSGDWVVPKLNGLRYFEKPVMGYWFNAISIATFGENPFAVRLPSALAAGLSALMIFLVMKTSGQTNKTAIFAVTGFLTCFLVFAIGTFAVLDGMFSMLITGAIASFFCANIAVTTKRRMVFLVIFGIFCGLAFLTKGFLAFLLPGIVIVPFLLWQRQWKSLFTLPWLPFVTAILVVLPWCIAIHLHESDFWRYFVFEEHLRRFAAENAQHKEPLWYYIPVLIGGALPWTALLPAACIGLAKTRIKDKLTRYAICWLVFPLLFFSTSVGKLGTYIIPCFPPLMILTAIGLKKYFQDPSRRTFTIGATILALLMGGATFTLALMPASNLTDFNLSSFIINERTLICIAIAVWAGLSFLSTRIKSPIKAITIFTIAPLLLMLSIPWLMNTYNNEKSPHDFLVATQAEVDANAKTVFVSSSYMAPAICWYYKRNDIYILQSSGEMHYGLSYDDSKYRKLEFRDFQKIVSNHDQTTNIVLMLGSGTRKGWSHLLPKNAKKHIDTLGFSFDSY